MRWYGLHGTNVPNAFSLPFSNASPGELERRKLSPGLEQGLAFPFSSTRNIYRGFVGTQPASRTGGSPTGLSVAEKYHWTRGDAEQRGRPCLVASCPRAAQLAHHKTITQHPSRVPRFDRAVANEALKTTDLSPDDDDFRALK